VINRILTRRGWRPRVIAYTGYGAQGVDGGDGWARILCRVLLAPPGTRRRDLRGGRGWRRFLSAPAPGVPVTVEVGGQRHLLTCERGGYIDARVTARLEAGWGQALLSVDGTSPAEAPLYVVGPGAHRGIVSDIDDTVMITALPRPLVALWNTAVQREAARKPVPGMAALYREILAQDPDTVVVYLSTGAWNVAPALEEFLARHGYPRGPLLMTDWGPTQDAWFRSGREHKRTQLRRLLAELPGLTWLLVGDDGQHDPELYGEVADASPDKVRAVAIRQLSAIEQVLTHGTPEPLPEAQAAPPRSTVEEVRAPDGEGLLAALRARGVLAPATSGP
jgi:phosphatidate phosphatase APP1